MPPKLLTDLPNEILSQIVFHLRPEDIPSLDLVSKQLRNLTVQPKLWQQFTRESYKYWEEQGSIYGKPGEQPSRLGFNWKDTYVRRHSIDRSVSRQIDSILSTQTGRIPKSAAAVKFGYDAKDILLRHLRIGDDADDVLARRFENLGRLMDDWLTSRSRFYSKAVLENLHRAAAIREWARMSEEKDVPLERALAAFDMFVSEDGEGDLDDVCGRFDGIAAQIRKAEPYLDDQSHRWRAVTIAKFLRHNGFTGVKGEAEYHALHHNFIGIALRDQEHQCLPLITVAIFCCVAQRLGLDAHPCGFPFHVHAIIKAKDGCDLDGRDISENLEARPMYMDPWNSSEEKPEEELISRLNEMKVRTSDHSTLLGVSSVADIVRRTARNIINSVKILAHRAGPGGLSDQPDSVNVETAFNAALWALFLLTEKGDPQASVQRGRYVSYMIEHLRRLFVLDVPLFEGHILSSFEGSEYYEALRKDVTTVRISDAEPKKSKRRATDQPDHVKYSVGQVFKHKRYSYQAIIAGWDGDCQAEEIWIAHMGVQNLPNGRHQAFYHALVEDKSIRYVAEENIEVTDTDDISPKLMAIAGQYFKRWDEQSKTFISNIRDEYPDD